MQKVVDNVVLRTGRSNQYNVFRGVARFFVFRRTPTETGNDTRAHGNQVETDALLSGFLTTAAPQQVDLATRMSQSPYPVEGGVRVGRAFVVSPVSDPLYFAAQFDAGHAASTQVSFLLNMGKNCVHGCGKDSCDFTVGKCACNHAAGRYGLTCQYEGLCQEGAKCSDGFYGTGLVACSSIAPNLTSTCQLTLCDSLFYKLDTHSNSCTVTFPVYIFCGATVIAALLALAVGFAVGLLLNVCRRRRYYHALK